MSGSTFNDMTKYLLDFDIFTVLIFHCAYFLWEFLLLVVVSYAVIPPIELNILSRPALALTALRLITRRDNSGRAHN